MNSEEYEIDYNDERFAQVEADKQTAMQDVENTYGDMINKSDQFYQSQIDATKEYADKQSQLQQEQTDFALEQIEQQKAQAEKDYQKEQSAAYVDYQKQSNKYNANAEQMAANGLTNTGYSESSQVAMYNEYQNRVASARESYNRATLNYDNAMKEAVLQNNSAMAEIAYNSLQQELSIALQGFQYGNALLSEQLSQKQVVEDRYYNRWQDVLSQLNHEKSMAEQVRQYNESMQFQREQFEQGIEEFKASYELQLKQYNENIRQFDEEMARLKEQDVKDNEYRMQQLALQKEQLEMEKEQWQKEYELELEQLEEKAIINKASGVINKDMDTSDKSVTEKETGAHSGASGRTHNGGGRSRTNTTSQQVVLEQQESNVSNYPGLSLLPRTLYTTNASTSPNEVRNTVSTNTGLLIPNTSTGLLVQEKDTWS